MIKNLGYDMIGAGKSNIYNHPQKQMQKLGLHYIKCEPVPIADCWWFRIDNYEETMKLPKYIYIL